MNLRAAVTAIICEVSVQGRSLSQAMESESLARQDRALVQELCYGVLRHYPRLELIVNGLLKKPFKSKDANLQILLMVGIYQLLYMRIPDHAAVSETVAATVSLKKDWARGLVNAVLRNFQRSQQACLAKADSHEAGRWLHPQWFIDAMRQAWPQDWQAILSANNQRPPMTLRVNLAKKTRQDYLAELTAAGVPGHALRFSEAAIVLERAIDVGDLPGFNQGWVSVQDEAAQLAASLLALQPGQRVLDVCAAPGGKTGHILETAAVDLVAVDVDAQRLARVQENLQRLQLSAQLVAGDASTPQAWWDGKPFERILLDAPCSATGVIRRHPDIKLLRKAQDVASLVATQARILDAVWPLLAPGGMLVYATCSVMPQENSAQIHAFLQRQDNAGLVTIQADWGRATSVGRQILPGDGVAATDSGGMDGFFYACLAKRHL